MKTYMEEHGGRYESVNSSRQIYKGMFIGGGAALFGLGALVLLVNPIGLAGMAAGAGIIAYAIVYFKKNNK